MFYKMADGLVVLCDCLCFLRHKFGKLPVRQIKSMLLDFYSVEVLSEAKCLLLQNVSDLQIDVRLPHIPRRRDSDNRGMLDVDDILTVFTCLDEQKLLDKLPRYVADSPDSVPSSRLYEGDLSCVMAMMNKLIEKMTEQASVLLVLSRDVAELKARCLPESSHLSTVVRDVDRAGEFRLQRAGIQEYPSGSFGSAATGESADHRTTTVQPPSADWATIASASASTPFVHRNRYAALASTDDDGDHSDAPPQHQQQPFVTVQSRRSKRRRQQTSPRSAVNPTTGPQERRRAPAVFGKSAAVGMKISAASRIRRRAVYCVDNVSSSCTEADITSFVESLSIKVLSCFEVRPRRRRIDDDIDRTAFRLCIYQEDSDRLLNASLWPESVVISQWYFKQPRSDDGKRLQQPGDQSAAAAVDPAAPAQSDAASAGNDDDTILVPVMDCSTTDNDNANSAVVNDGCQ